MKITKSEMELNNLRTKKLNIELKIKEQKRELNKELRKTYPKIFLLMSILMITGILFNIGAMVITHALVLENNPNKVFTESNPFYAKFNNLKENEIANVKFTSFVFQISIYVFLLLALLYNRYHISSKKEMYLLLAVTIFVAVSWGYDFANDLGYWIGKMIWGA